MAIKPAPGPAAGPRQPETLPTAKKGFSQIVGELWQLITALIGLVTVVAAGVTYFATREQLNQNECKANNQINLVTYSALATELRIQIQLAQIDQEELERKGLGKDSREWRQRQAEIDDDTAKRNRASEQYDKEYLKYQQHGCESKQAEKKP